MRSNYAFNNPEEDLQNAVKTSAALDLSKTDDTQETNDLIYSPTANVPYDKTELKWRLSPKCTHLLQFTRKRFCFCLLF